MTNDVHSEMIEGNMWGGISAKQTLFTTAIFQSYRMGGLPGLTRG